ncbi:hypothetical protein [Streptomyces sp. NPDC012746]|uniref:hypothetical protein n=1 Tax=Streptomyces sp. NPDC012746 TaxID=3364845 RepID=UPI003678D169
MIEVGQDGAFSVNCVGLERLPFPLSFSAVEAGGSWLVSGAAARAAELVDLLVRTANETILVAELATNSFMDEEFRQWPMSRIAADQGVAYEVHRGGAPDDDEEVLVLDRDSLPRFLADGWSPYELSLLDLPTPDGIDDAVLLLGAAHLDEPVLPCFEGSRLRFSGHDDCYVAIESTDPALPGAVFGRLLALLAGAELADGRPDPVRVPEPDPGAMAELIAASAHWIGGIAAASTDSVTIGLSAIPACWRLGQQPPPTADHLATLDLPTRTWTLAPAPASAPDRA